MPSKGHVRGRTRPRRSHSAKLVFHKSRDSLLERDYMAISATWTQCGSPSDGSHRGQNTVRVVPDNLSIIAYSRSRVFVNWTHIGGVNSSCAFFPIQLSEKINQRPTLEPYRCLQYERCAVGVPENVTHVGSRADGASFQNLSDPSFPHKYLWRHDGFISS